MIHYTYCYNTTTTPPQHQLCALTYALLTQYTVLRIAMASALTNALTTHRITVRSVPSCTHPRMLSNATLMILLREGGGKYSGRGSGMRRDEDSGLWG